MELDLKYVDNLIERLQRDWDKLYEQTDVYNFAVPRAQLARTLIDLHTVRANMVKRVKPVKADAAKQTNK